MIVADITSVVNTSEMKLANLTSEEEATACTEVAVVMIISEDAVVMTLEKETVAATPFLSTTEKVVVAEATTREAEATSTEAEEVAMAGVASTEEATDAEAISTITKITAKSIHGMEAEATISNKGLKDTTKTTAMTTSNRGPFTTMTDKTTTAWTEA